MSSPAQIPRRTRAGGAGRRTGAARGARTRLAVLLVAAVAAGPLAGAQQPEPAGPPTPSATPAAGAVPETPSHRNASYSIDVSLDTSAHTLTGRGVITWRNVTDKPAAELRLHLYWNAWRNTNSTWLRERRLGAGTRRGPAVRDPVDLPEGDWAAIDVTALRLLGVGAAPPIDLLAGLRFVAPDDGNPHDRTVAAVPLPVPVQPGETINVAVDWTSRIPRTFARTGRIGQYYFIAHWFPKVAVLEPGGWVSHQFHAGTEFYADFGRYDVRITVPAGWVVGATGRRQASDGGGTVHRFVQDDVHDFAWVTSPDLVEHRARFEHPRLPAVDIRLLLQPEHAGQAGRHVEATRAALRYYGEWFGPYPYGHVTVVDPAWQSGSGGMEYPTLFTAGTRWLAPDGVTQPESVTIHEAGHQFWYLLVANNEVQHAWLDEGLNTFSTARVIGEAFSPAYYSERFFGGFVPWVYRDLPLPRASMYNGLPGYRSAAKSDPQSRPTWQYFPPTGPFISYSKTALWLHTLERLLGWPTLQRILSTFFQRWQFRHPAPADFFAVANEVSGRDLTWFFDQVHGSSTVFDYAIESLESRPAVVAGFTDDSPPRFTQRTDTGQFETTVVARRHGEAFFPVDVVVRFANGERWRERWEGRERWRAFRMTGPSRAVSAEVDPDRILLLDVNRTNNGVSLSPASGAAATKWALPWLTWLQDRLLTFGVFF